MPTQEAIEALLKLRKEQQQNSTDPFTFTSDRLGQRPVRRITGETEQETEDRIKKDKVSLFQALGAGLYEFGESASFGLLGLGEIGVEKALGEELDFQESMRKYQEDSSLAAILGGVGTGAGFLLGAPLKLTGKLLQKPATALIAKATKGQTIGKATADIKKAAVKSGIESKLANEFGNVVTGSTISASAKNKLANEAFTDTTTGFFANLSKSANRKLARKEITQSQYDAILEMGEQVASRGVPLQNISQFARTKYGNTRFGRFATEALHDAFVFSVSDAVMDASFQSQQMLKGEQEEFNLGQVGYSVATGFLAGTAINAATAPFKPLGKMLKSRTDFAQGLRTYLTSRKMYENEPLENIVNSMVGIANNNRKNAFSTSFDYKNLDGVKKSQDLLESDNQSHKTNIKRITAKLIDELGEKDARTKSINWLMSQKKIYGREMLAEATREGMQNYRLIFPRMFVAGAAMAGTQGVQAYATGNELRAEDYISSVLIGAWTQRRGNFAREVDLGKRIQELRSTLEFVGVDTKNTVFGTTFTSNTNMFGVGLARDNERLSKYLKDERIVSDEDESVESGRLAEDERVFYEDVNGNPIDPHNGRMEYVYGLLSQDFKYKIPKDQISERQANEIINILEKQGFKTLDDFDKAYEDRIAESTTTMKESLVSVLRNIEKAEFEDFGITSDTSSKQMSIPKIIEINTKLLDRARDGEFKEWLSDKDGEKAVEEIRNAFRSLDTVIRSTMAIDSKSAKLSNEGTTINSSDTLKDVYNIVRDSEKAIQSSVDPKDSRAEFRFSDVHSYLMPVIHNEGKKYTKNVMSNLQRNNMTDKLKTALFDVGILQKVDGELKIIDDVSKIKVDEEYKTKFDDLTKLHNVLVALGEFDPTSTAINKKVETGNISRLKSSMLDSGIDLSRFNDPNTKFLYQMLLNDISNKRLKDSVASQADIDFIVQQSGNSLLSERGLLGEGGLRGFTLNKIDAPEDRDFQNEYNKKINELDKESGVVNISDKVRVLTGVQVEEVKFLYDSIYNVATANENMGMENLFRALTNSGLESPKNRMLAYMQVFGKRGQIRILSMLKRQGIIDRNADGNLEVNKKFTIEKLNNELGEAKTEEERQKILDLQSDISKDFKEALNPIIDNLDGQGVNHYVENEIKEREKIKLRYQEKALDEDVTPSMGVDEFFRKYKFFNEVIDGEGDFIDYRDQSSEWKSDHLKGLDFILDDLGNKVPKANLINVAKTLVKDDIKFDDMDGKDQDKVIQDLTQVVRGVLKRKSVKKVSIVNGEVIYNDDATSREVMQGNPIFDKLESLGLDYGIFDNNVVYTEFGRYVTEKSYNILSTQGLSDNQKSHILFLRGQVQNYLGNNLLNKNLSALSQDNIQIADKGNKGGMLKLDIFDGLDSIVIDRSSSSKIAQDFIRFSKDHISKIDNANVKRQVKKLVKEFKNAKQDYDYTGENIELATRFLIYEAAYRSKDNEVFYRVLNENSAKNVDTYLKRMKLATTKNFIRSDKTFYEALIDAKEIVKNGDKKSTQVLKNRLEKHKGKYRIAVWDDEGTETMSTLIDDVITEYKDQYPELENFSTKHTIGEAHADVSAFDSISFLSKDMMMEMHTIMGHSPNSKSPIKPVISSQGEGKTLLYGKTLFVYSPSLSKFFKNNPVDVLLTKSGAKAYDVKADKEGTDISIIRDTRWSELNDFQIGQKSGQTYSNLVKEIDLDGIGLRPEKEAVRISASESDADYNYMNRREHEAAFREMVDELDASLTYMDNIKSDSFKLRSFMLEQLNKGNIPDDAEDGALKNLSNFVYFLQLDRSANPNDYSSAQVNKYLSKVYIDNIFSNRRAIVNHVYSQDKQDAFRYGGQGPLVQTAGAHQGGKLKTRLLPTLFNKDRKMILRGEIMLPDAERESDLTKLGRKKIRIVNNEAVFTIEEFKQDLKKIEQYNNKEFDKEFDKQFDNAMTLEAIHGVLLKYNKDLNKEGIKSRYQLGIISRRNPRTRPNDITLLGLKGFLDKDTGLAVEINSYDIANIYEGDYDADKVDYFFAHSDYMFDYIKRNDAHFVQGVDISKLQEGSEFTFALDATTSRNTVLSKIGNAIAFKKGIGIVQKTHRKLNYLQNLTDISHLTYESEQDKINKLNDRKWRNIIRQNVNGELVGPGVLYEAGKDNDGNNTEIITMDTESLSYFQRAALEVQYVIDGANKFNKKLGNNLYEWSDKFLFPDLDNSLSPKNADAQDSREIYARGRNGDGRRIRIFQRFKLDSDGIYREVALNEADKLVIKEFLNQQNKLLASFGDDTYEGGQKRKTSFYDMAIGSKAFKEFHEDIYKSLNRHFFPKSWKRKDLDKANSKYLDDLINPENDFFNKTKSRIQNIAQGQGGNYLDRIAVKIADKEFLDNKREYHMTTANHMVMDNWFKSLIAIEPGQIKTDDDGNTTIETQEMSQAELDDFESSLDRLTKGIKSDTQQFNSIIATIKRLDKNKNYIRRSKYPEKWKQSKVKSIDWVINKMKDKLQNQYKVPKNKLHTKDLKYKNYVSIESNSDLVDSVVHANTMDSLLRGFGYGMNYDSWYDTLGDEARKDMKTILDFNRLEYGKGALIDEVLAFKDRTLVDNEDLMKMIREYRPNISTISDLRNQYLTKMVEKHKLNFLYAYMEPRRNKDDIGVFNNRPISIPYKETARYKQGIQLLTGFARGNIEFAKDESVKQRGQKVSEFVLKSIMEGNNHYRIFFNKDTSLIDFNNLNHERFGIMGFDKNTRMRLNENSSDFSWTKEMLPNNPLSTINKSVMRMYSDYADLIPDANAEKYQDFLQRLNDLEEFSARQDYLNPIKYAHLRMSLDKDFLDMMRKDIYNIAGDNMLPDNIKNNPMYAHMEFLKYEPKQAKSPNKAINMLKVVSEANNALHTAARQNPLKDSGYEVFNKMGEYLKCQ
jgi:hypothetical protein|tara:strand:- start:3213 stop:11942 length:8730 start_codon:yes stop_codon:yes gene_type:complete